MKRHTQFGMGLLLSCLSISGFSAPADFPRPKELQPAVDFWKSVFAKHGKYEVMLHDERHVHQVFKVIDYSDRAPKNFNDRQLWDWVRIHSVKDLAIAKNAFDQAHAHRNDPSKLGPEARRAWEMYKDFPEENKYIHAKNRLRIQRGVKERHQTALFEAGRYMPYMERTFRNMGLPEELTRLPYVESSFNVKAYSHVQAAGIWQFMPTTARLYMRYDNLVDDRRDPWFSTEGAAKHLRDDYKMLKSWPLAVTAYNQGRAGINRAAKAVGSYKLEDIIAKYDGGRFGFAGRNFYVELLAAIDIHANPEPYFGKLQRAPETQFDQFVTKHYVPLEALRRLSGLSNEAFAEINPAYGSAKSGATMIPSGHTVRIPHGSQDAYAVAYANMPSKLLATSQPRGGAGTHKVARGETLSTIAKRYKTSYKSIQSANGLKRANSISIGQTLKIPGRGTPGVSSTLLAQVKPMKFSGAAPVLVANVPVSAPIEIARAELPAVSKPIVTLRSEPVAVAAKMISKPIPRDDIQNNEITSAAVEIETKPDAQSFAVHRIKKGQTLSGVAKSYKVSVAALQAANNLKASSTLSIGQTLKVPSEGAAKILVAEAKQEAAAKPTVVKHSVAKGQTLSGIAKQYDSEVPDIRKANRLGRSSALRIGQVLDVPAGAKYEALATERTVKTENTAIAASSIQHKVARGQTIAVIAKRYGTSAQAIAKLNNLKSVHTIRAGQSLKIPVGNTPTPAAEVAERKLEPQAKLVNKDHAVAEADPSTNSSMEIAAFSVEHTVSNGQTVSEIAKRYDTTAAAIKQANELDSVSVIGVGDTLKIPTGKGYTVANIQAPTRNQDLVASINTSQAYRRIMAQRTSAKSDAFSQTAADNHLTAASKPSPINEKHNVAKGETIWNIAKLYNTTVRAIKSMNGISNEKQIQVGDRLVIPGEVATR